MEPAAAAVPGLLTRGVGGRARRLSQRSERLRERIERLAKRNDRIERRSSDASRADAHAAANDHPRSGVAGASGGGSGPHTVGPPDVEVAGEEEDSEDY